MFLFTKSRLLTKQACTFVSICLGLLLYSCTRPCRDSDTLMGSFLVITPFHRALDQFFYPEDEFRSPFKRDSLQVINEDGRRFEKVSFQLNQDPRGGNRRIYEIGVAPAFIIPDDNDAFQRGKNRKMYLRYNHTTTDTLTLVFKARTDRCGNSEYEYLKIYYRDTLIASTQKEVYKDFTLNH